MKRGSKARSSATLILCKLEAMHVMCIAVVGRNAPALVHVWCIWLRLQSRCCLVFVVRLTSGTVLALRVLQE